MRSGLVEGQAPKAVILTCSDSRVVPEFIFDTKIGELFVVRVAGNIASKSSIASIEYSVASLGVRLLIVLGHQNCGAVSTAQKNKIELGENLNHLISHIDPVIKHSQKCSINELVKLNVKNTENKLIENSVILKSSFESGVLKVVNGYYSLESGLVEIL